MSQSNLVPNPGFDGEFYARHNVLCLDVSGGFMQGFSDNDFSPGCHLPFSGRFLIFFMVFHSLVMSLLC